MSFGLISSVNSIDFRLESRLDLFSVRYDWFIACVLEDSKSLVLDDVS